MSAEVPVTARIAAVRNSLQPSERRVADLIVDDPDAVIELTAQQIADRVGVGRSSVVRACQTFGYRGYPQLRVALAAERGRRTVAPATADGPLGGIRAAIDRIADDLRAVTSLLDAEGVTEAVAAVVAARRLLVVASGLSAPVATDLAMRLTAVGRPAETVGDPIGQQIAARHLDPEDVCVVISGSGANEASLRAASAARAAGARVIALTSFSASPLTERADLSLVLASGGTFRDELEHTSRIAHAVFAEAFVDAVAAARADDAALARSRVLEILSDNLGDAG
ncbi:MULTISPECIES: MurR/RpiR family transcriptional regulator [Microbacterium]|uniref:MurR/RpiR family transcriptional regulator n=1 Tax=Microbacterium TaxID=33882 RepID=UPI00278675C7|nr:MULTISPECIES: MurR/RpiR family transcriptional regulator [Microbacterium]MDQ1075946.1 RpiR family carbohydrate utilization transcriptional regulator [Microbacterium sp. SORGH_AS_0969]MDQ1116189.1 RpiR family carbohydrate utilization transcriptional regulator [Microbacterium testaceum]